MHIIQTSYSIMITHSPIKCKFTFRYFFIKSPDILPFINSRYAYINYIHHNIQILFFTILLLFDTTPNFENPRKGREKGRTSLIFRWISLLVYMPKAMIVPRPRCQTQRRYHRRRPDFFNFQNRPFFTKIETLTTDPTFIESAVF